MRLFEMFAVSLFLTLLIESGVAAFWGVGRQGMKIVWLVNTLTNPAAVFLAWLLALRCPSVPRPLLQLPLEAVVILTEAGIYRSFSREEKWGIGRPVRLSLCANLISWGIGLIM